MMSRTGPTPRVDESVRAAAELLGGLARHDVPIGPMTTYKVGGSAALFVRAESIDDVRLVSEAVRVTGVAVLVIGRGSNLLVSDAGFAGVAVQLGEFASSIEFPPDVSTESSAGESDFRTVRAGAAVALPVLARRTAGAGLRGFEWAVGVPGSVGGAVRMNAGGHGSDMSEVLTTCTVLDLATGSVSDRVVGDIGLRFRGSSLGDDDVVLAADIRLVPGDIGAAQREIDDIVRWRRENQPGGQNAGSVFVNPVPGEVAAGRLIDELGLRGFRIGTAAVSAKHANFIQADDGGRAGDVVSVMDHVRRLVEERFGYRLRTEVRLVGFQVEES